VIVAYLVGFLALITLLGFHPGGIPRGSQAPAAYPSMGAPTQGHVP
jgi:hypothetical protein